MLRQEGPFAESEDAEGVAFNTWLSSATPPCWGCSHKAFRHRSRARAGLRRVGDYSRKPTEPQAPAIYQLLPWVGIWKGP